jgi:hypothetical protein
MLYYFKLSYDGSLFQSEHFRFSNFTFHVTLRRKVEKKILNLLLLVELHRIQGYKVKCPGDGNIQQNSFEYENTRKFHQLSN